MLTALVFPSECEICDASLSHKADGVCAPCERTIRSIPAPHCPSCGRTRSAAAERCGECADGVFHFDEAFATAHYDGAMRELLHRFKFEGRHYLKKALSARLVRFCREHLADRRFDAVLAVPLSAARMKERGFNQSRLLSKPLARALGLPEASSRLNRKRTASPQHRLSKELRAENVHGCFGVAPGASFAGQKLLLVDDILTTGLTASECARTLKLSGAASVTVLAVARGI